MCRDGDDGRPAAVAGQVLGFIGLGRMGGPIVVGAAVRQMLAVTKARFGPASDFTSIARVVEEWAGVEIRG